MKLAKLKIANYRSIKELDLSFPRSGILVLVGANNAGKSNVIRAIDAVCGEQWFGKDKVAEHDHYLRDKSNPIDIILQFEGGWEARWNSEKGWANMYDPSGGWVRDPKPKDAYPCIYLGADRTFDKHMSFYDWTLIGRIRKAFQRRAQPHVEQLKRGFEDIIKVFDQVEGFSAFKSDFAELFSQMQADTSAKLSIDFKPYTPSNYFKTMQVVAEDGDSGQKLDLDELGEGTRNMVLLSLLRSYAKNFRGAVQEVGGVLALEEPEIYMHPQARRHLYRVLRDIAEGGIQVVISTHSASFVDTEFFDSVGRVVKVPDDENEGRKFTTVKRVTSRQMVALCTRTGVPARLVDEERIAEFYKASSNPLLREAFFARFLILVEGDTEEMAIPVLLEARGVDCDRLGISVIGVRGKSQIPKYWRLFTAFQIPVLAICDNDDRGEKVKANELIATCFGLADGDLVALGGPTLFHRGEPDGSLLALDGDYENSLRRDFGQFLPSGDKVIVSWETESQKILGPRANKGLVARFVARKLMEEHPKFVPKLVQKILCELERAELTVPLNGASKATDDDEWEDGHDEDDDIPF